MAYGRVEAFGVQKPGRYQSEAWVEVGGDSICISKEYFIQNLP